MEWIIPHRLLGLLVMKKMWKRRRRCLSPALPQRANLASPEGRPRPLSSGWEPSRGKWNRKWCFKNLGRGGSNVSLPSCWQSFHDTLFGCLQVRWSLNFSTFVTVSSMFHFRYFHILFIFIFYYFHISFSLSHFIISFSIFHSIFLFVIP